MSDTLRPVNCRRCFCRRCDRFVIAGASSFPLSFHANAVAATCFLWLPIALIAALWHAALRAGFRCPNCDTRCR